MDVCYGKDYKHLNEGNFPVLGTGGVMGYVDEYLYSGESILIGRKGTIDKPKYINGPFWTVDTLFFTKIKEGNPKFIFYQLNKINWLKYNEASGVPSLSANNIKNIKIKIPSLEEQKKIASFLSAVDKKIELLEKKHLLITYEKEYYLNLFFNENTGKNSNNFKKVKLGDILSLQGGFNFDSRMFDKYSNNPVIKIGDIPHNLDLENFKGNFSKQNCGEKYKVKSGDILIALSGATFGKSGKVSGNGIAFINQRVAKFICKKCDTNYIFQLLNSSKFKKYLNTIPTSSAQPNISNKDILNYPTFIPELNKQIIIGNFLGNIDNQIELIEDKVFHMKRFKKFLLQKMFV